MLYSDCNGANPTYCIFKIWQTYQVKLWTPRKIVRAWWFHVDPHASILGDLGQYMGNCHSLLLCTTFGQKENNPNWSVFLVGGRLLLPACLCPLWYDSLRARWLCRTPSTSTPCLAGKCPMKKQNANYQFDFARWRGSISPSFWLAQWI